MKYQAVARQKIIGAQNDQDLRALEGIIYGPIYECEEITKEIEEKLIEELLEGNPEFSYDSSNVELVKD